jgi:hypothetical protein
MVNRNGRRRGVQTKHMYHPAFEKNKIKIDNRRKYTKY